VYSAGQERFRSIALSYYRGAHGAIFIYDITQEETLRDIPNKWVKDLRENNEHAVFGVIGNKLDLPRNVTHEQGQVRITFNFCRYS
jgi:GTPase SAR1 family protein